AFAALKGFDIFKGGENMLIPMTMLSLFVLSTAVMGYLFVFEPVRLYVEGQKQEAAGFFLKTVGAFAVFAVAFIVLLLYTTRGLGM
ncbi:MAG: hypothetical protein AAB923_01400, partial [Patescibacteria group bacterium]